MSQLVNRLRKNPKAARLLKNTTTQGLTPVMSGYDRGIRLQGS